MKCPKALGTISVNSSTNFNRKPRLIRKLERILIKLYRQNVSLLFNQICLNERLLFNPTHTHTHTHTHIYIDRVISNSIEWYLMPPWLTVSIKKVRVKGKWSNHGKGVATFPAPLCTSYWKEIFLVTIDYGRPTIYKYICFYYNKLFQ